MATKSYIIYIHKTPSGKVYIGQTCQSTNRRWRNGEGYKKSCPVFYRAIQKYGWENIEHKVLFSNLSLEDANMIEQDLIYYYKKSKISYNICDGGGGSVGRKWSIQTRQKYKEYLASNPIRKKITHISNTKKIYQFTIDGIFIAEYNSIKDACIKFNCTNSNLVHALKKHKTACGFLWSYTKDVHTYEKWSFSNLDEQIKTKIISNIATLNCKPVVQYTKNGEIIAEYPSASEAARQLGVSVSCIKDVCKGRQKTTKEYVYRYKKL